MQSLWYVGWNDPQSTERNKGSQNVLMKGHFIMSNQNMNAGESDFIPEIRIEKHPLAMALDAIHSESYEGASGCFNMRPRLKVSYAICASTPTVEMQKNAIAKFSELISAERDEDGNANWLCDSFELEQCQLGKDTVSFIGKIGKYHEPFEDIQETLRHNWEHASQEAGVESKSECKGMEIILN